MSKHNLSGARDRLLADLSRRRFVTGLAIGGAATAAGLAEAAAIRDRVGAAMTPAELAEARDLVGRKWQSSRR